MMLKNQEVELELLHQQLKGAEEELKDTCLKEQEQKETVAIFKQKYTAAIEKVNRLQRQVELLEEELQYSQQQVNHSLVIQYITIIAFCWLSAFLRDFISSIPVLHT